MSTVAWKVLIKVPGVDGQQGEEIKVETEGAKLWHALQNTARIGKLPDVRKATIEIEARG